MSDYQDHVRDEDVPDYPSTPLREGVMAGVDAGDVADGMQVRL